MIKCKLCNKEFSTIRFLSKHLNMLHDGFSKEEYYLKFIENNANNQCTFCNNKKRFISITKGYHYTCGNIDCDNKSGHLIRKKKKKNSEIKCELCNKQFTQLRSLSLHLHNQHKNISKKEYFDNYILNDKNLICKICNKNERKFKNIEKGYRQTCGSNDCVIANRMQKLNNACLEKYGVNKVLKLDFFKEKTKQTFLKNFGESNPSQNVDIFLKQKYKWKIFTFPSGRTAKIQGYEDIALNNLLQLGYHEDDIIVCQKDMPKIIYFNLNKQHRYYPDIFIPKDNLIIEVKSTYTYKISIEKNLLKQKACLDAGYNFKFMIFGNGEWQD